MLIKYLFCSIIKNFSNISFFIGLLLIFFSIISYIIRGSLLNIKEIIFEWEIISLFRNKIIIIFIFDYISFFFLRVVNLISGRVIIYSTSYISSEIFFRRFIIIVLLFIISIYLLILSPNIISLLLGWDRLGVTSYLLVIFYQRKKSYNAGIITAITNRLGDVGILICISLIFLLGDWTYMYLSNSSFCIQSYIVFILIISASTKRAQIPFSAWLPAAIAAPTPVSALVHSSTLVTAGVYLIIRLNFIFCNSSSTNILLFIGVITMVLAGAAAIYEIDIKKVIALSTLSQLGVIMITLGELEPILSFFHLLRHAYFKAILFICAGIIIHNIKDYQDIRKIGFSYINIHFCISIIIIANISLCGLPFLRGFYSKDFIIEIILIKGKNIFFLFLIIFGTILTVIYSCRLNLLISINFIKVESYYFIRENSLHIIIGIIFLLPFSIIGGIIISWNLIRSNKIIFIPLWIKSIVFVLILFSIYLYLYIYKYISTYYKNILIFFFRNMWFLPNSVNLSIRYFFLNNSFIIFKYIEISWSEIIIFKKFFFFINNNYLRKFFDYFSFIYIFQTIEIFFLFIFFYIFFI